MMTDLENKYMSGEELSTQEQQRAYKLSRWRDTGQLSKKEAKRWDAIVEGSQRQITGEAIHAATPAGRLEETLGDWEKRDGGLHARDARLLMSLYRSAGTDITTSAELERAKRAARNWLAANSLLDEEDTEAVLRAIQLPGGAD